MCYEFLKWNDIEAFFRRSTALGFRSATAPTLGSICSEADDKLFAAIALNPFHFHHLLLPRCETHYSLRLRSHDFTLSILYQRNGPYTDGILHLQNLIKIEWAKNVHCGPAAPPSCRGWAVPWHLGSQVNTTPGTGPLKKLIRFCSLRVPHQNISESRSGHEPQAVN